MIIKTLILFILFSFQLALASAPEVIRYTHKEAKFQCEEKAKSVAEAKYSGYEYKITGQTRELAGREQECEEAQCVVSFKNKTWKYTYDYIVCNEKAPANYVRTEIERKQKRNAVLTAEIPLAPTMFVPQHDKLAADELYIDKLSPKVMGRQPASVALPVMEKPKVDMKKLNCQTFIEDINQWLITYDASAGKLEKDAEGKLFTMKESPATQTILKKFATNKAKLDKIKSNLELAKVKLQVLDSQGPKNDELVEKNKTEYNQLTQVLFNEYLTIAKKECFTELVDNHSKILSELYREKSHPKTQQQSIFKQFFKGPNGFSLEKDRKPATDPVIER
ncbi:MAG: hypothetical protein JNM93_06440 [Bacteriovoracaceae bacterium]|nr:hypothetical protein [Bacteriovoracaceae bacterium]